MMVHIDETGVRAGIAKGISDDFWIGSTLQATHLAHRHGTVKTMKNGTYHTVSPVAPDSA